jgi:LCP family protein required for cell wall assembly
MTEPWDRSDGTSAHPDAPARRQGQSRGRGRAAAAAPAPQAAGRAARRKQQKPRKKKALKIAGATVAGLVLVTAGTGAWLYNHFSGNLTTVSLDQGGQKVGGTETPDAFGRTPINVLLIGTDARKNAEDCNLGGACNGGTVGDPGYGNADVEMLVHVSADRSNASVVSIPRDSMVNVPACSDDKTKTHTNGYFGMVNSALAYGPACQVATIHQLTGVPIDHFAMVDFSGVVKMSDALGGADVCVSANVYDTYSHLKLKAGKHTLKGEAALMFVRTRHGFGDGGDIGRTIAQHMYLGSIMRNLKSAGTLANPVAMYSIGDAITKALTVDDDLDSVAKLAGLAADLNKVPTNRITMTTMQTAPDPKNADRLVPASNAKDLFKALATDQSLSNSGGGAAAAPSSAAPATQQPDRVAAGDLAQISVRVENGSGVSGRATSVSDGLTGQGFSSSVATGKAPASATTTLSYGSGHKADAEKVAAALNLPVSHLREGVGTHLTLLIGSDWSGTTTFAGGAAPAASGGSPEPVNTQAALAQANVQTADQGDSCAQVSTYRTVEINGVSMTPTQAYAKATDVPDSAP